MATRQPADFDRYHRLHPEGRRLIRGWFGRAAGDHHAHKDFASFIYLWIAFNGWAACVTGKDSDRAWLDALTADPSLNERFDQLIGEPSATAAAAREFAELWPIFRISDLRTRGIDYRDGVHGTRAEMTEAFFAAGATKFEPQCVLEHDEVPLDWGHTLVALYRVRCNLFHGEKGRSSESDRVVISRAHATLLGFLEGAALL